MPFWESSMNQVNPASRVAGRLTNRYRPRRCWLGENDRPSQTFRSPEVWELCWEGCLGGSGFTTKVYTPKGGMLDTVSGAEGESADRRYAAEAARSSRGRAKSGDRAMMSWFLVSPRYSPRVSRYLRRRLSNATRLNRAASSREMDDPPRENKGTVVENGVCMGILVA